MSLTSMTSTSVITVISAKQGRSASRNGFYLMSIFSSRRRHTRFDCDWSSDVCSSDLGHDVPVWDSHDRFGDTALLVENMDMGRDLAKHIGAGATALMRGHGATVAGKTIRQAVDISAYLDVNARLQKQPLGVGEGKFRTSGHGDKVAERTGPSRVKHA